MSAIGCQQNTDTLHVAAHELMPAVERGRDRALRSTHSRVDNFRAEPRGIHR
jgi:hypothetical protein